MTPVITASTIPVTIVGTLNSSNSVVAIVLVSTMPLMTNANGITRIENRIPNHFCFRPSAS